MKTIKKIEITPIFVEDYIPTDLKQNCIYISRRYKTSVHLCLCGCGNISVTPLNKDGWNLIEFNDKITFTPSILNTNCPNKYHYIITNNIANIC